MRRAVLQRLARLPIRSSPSSAALASFAAPEKGINSCFPIRDSVTLALSREGQATFDTPRSYSASPNPAAYALRNYANDIYEYNKVLDDLCQSKRAYLMRDVYEDMQLDGVRPIRNTFSLLINGCMRGQRLQDSMYFFDEMKVMGLQPDNSIYNCIITTCGHAGYIERAFQVAAEMEASGMKPTHRTFLALLNACATTGRVEVAYGVVQRMAAFGLTLNGACYALLIQTHKISRPVNHVTFQKIFELLEQSKGCDALAGDVDGRQDFEEELANLVTGGGLQPTRSYVNRRLNVYYSALRACGELGNIEAVEKVIEMLKQENHQIDATCINELVKAYVLKGQYQKAVQVVDEYVESGRNPSLNLYVTLIESLLQRRNSYNSAAAKKLLDQMSDRGFFLNSTFGSNFLFLASLDREGDYETANTIWDMLRSRNQRPSIRSITTYSNGLQLRNVPEDDVRLAAARELLAKLQKKDIWISGAQASMAKEGEHEEEHGDGEADHESEEISSEHVAEDQSSELVAEHQSSELVTEHQSSEAVAEDQSSDLVAEHQSSEPVAEDQSSELVAEHQSSEPVAEDQSSELVAEHQSMEVVAENERSEHVAAVGEESRSPLAG